MPRATEQAAAEAALAAARDALGRGRAGPRGDRTGAGRRARAAGRRRFGARPAGGGGARAGRSAGGEGRRALAADGGCAERSRRAGDRARRGAGRGADLGRRPRAARHWRELPPFDPAPKLPAGATPLAGLVQAPPALARVLVADRAGGDEPTAKARRPDWPRAGAGVARRRGLALGRLHDPGRHADRRRGPPAAAQPAVAAAARPGRGARGGDSGAAGGARPRRGRPGGDGGRDSRRAPARADAEQHLERARARTSSCARSATEIAARLAAIDTRSSA